MLIAASLLLFQTPSVALERGLNGYWSCEDTTLDRTAPDEFAGGDAVLFGGPGKTVLVQFRDLRSRIPQGMRVKDARLVLTFGTGAPKLAQCREISLPWTEGPFRSVGNDRSAVASRFGCTWNSRRSGSNPTPWNLAGARGDADATALTTAKGEQLGEDRYVISGLGASVQKQSERWWQNNGFALEFTEPVEFLSSNANEGRPRLELDLEPAPAAAKSVNLTVVSISRTPEYPRYKVKETVVDGIGAPDVVENLDAKKWPFEGEKLTYTARVRNTGQTATAFRFQWSQDEQPQGIKSGPAELKPGEEASLTFEAPFRSLHSDHRRQTLDLEVMAEGDTDPDDSRLEIAQNGLNLAAAIPDAAMQEIARQGGNGYAWLQQQLRFWNETYCRYSRFSFAPEGVIERVRLQSVDIADAAPASDNVDGSLLVNPEWLKGQALNEPCRPLMKAIASACGLVDVSNGTPAPFGGINGGDTRFDGGFPSVFWMPMEPWSDMVADSIRTEPTGLLNAIEAAAMNSRMGKRGGYSGEYLYDIPGQTLVSVVNRKGELQKNVDVRFALPSGATFTLNTGGAGTVSLPSRPVGNMDPTPTQTGHRLRPNPYGRINTAGTGDVLTAEMTVNGVTARATLPAWQLAQSFCRGQKDIAFINLYFDVPGAKLSQANAALGKLTGDLKTLTDSDRQAQTTGLKAPIEIDLGQEITLAEVKISGAALWDSFEIQVRGNGQTPEQNRRFAKELMGSWAKQAREENGSVPYRGLAQKVRYVTLKPLTGTASLAEIEVTPAAP